MDNFTADDCVIRVGDCISVDSAPAADQGKDPTPVNLDYDAQRDYCARAGGPGQRPGPFPGMAPDAGHLDRLGLSFHGPAAGRR